jgi:hypothetical protein
MITRSPVTVLMSVCREIVDHGLQQGASFVKEFATHLLDQISISGITFRPSKLVLRLRHDSFQAHNHHVLENMRLGFRWPTPHVLLLKLDDRLADFGLDLPLGFFDTSCYGIHRPLRTQLRQPLSSIQTNIGFQSHWMSRQCVGSAK